MNHVDFYFMKTLCLSVVSVSVSLPAPVFLLMLLATTVEVIGMKLFTVHGLLHLTPQTVCLDVTVLLMVHRYGTMSSLCSVPYLSGGGHSADSRANFDTIHRG